MPLSRCRSALFVAVCVGILSSVNARADPISVTFQVHVTESCKGDACVPVSVLFPLVVSFDSAVTLAIDRPDYIERNYGVPTFSSIPLPPLPEVFPSATETTRTLDITQQEPVPSLLWLRQSAAQTNFIGFSSGLRHQWLLQVAHRRRRSTVLGVDR
jgi:hypothetical protein